MVEQIPTNKPNLEKSDEREVVFKEVAELELPIKIIIEKIRPRIENGEYGLIIGDDASGRIPTLILGNFIQKISEERGMEKPNIIFIPGKLRSRIFGRDNDRKEFEEYVGKFGATKEKRVLLVTDTILSGGSLEILVKLLKRSGYICDIATIGIEGEPVDTEAPPKDLEYLDTYENKLSGAEIISGEYKSEESSYSSTPKIYKEKTLSGVTKKAGQTRSKTIKSEELDEQEKEWIQLQINQARKDTSIVTEHLISWYESLPNEK